MCRVTWPQDAPTRPKLSRGQAWHFSASEAWRHGNAGGRAHLLLSLGADGRLLVWDASSKLANPIMA